MPSGCFLEEHTAGNEEVGERKQTNKETNKNNHLVLQLLLCLFILIMFQHQEAHQSTACSASPSTPTSASSPSAIRHQDHPAPALPLPTQDIWYADIFLLRRIYIYIYIKAKTNERDLWLGNCCSLISSKTVQTLAALGSRVGTGNQSILPETACLSCTTGWPCHGRVLRETLCLLGSCCCRLPHWAVTWFSASHRGSGSLVVAELCTELPFEFLNWPWRVMAEQSVWSSSFVLKIWACQGSRLAIPA